MSAQSCVIRGEVLGDYERDRYACRRCTDTIARHLREIGIYAVMLPQMTAPAVAGRGAGPGRPRHELCPVNVDVLDAMDSWWGEITTMARMVAEERGDTCWTSPLGYLLATLDWCARQLWIDEHAGTIASLHRRLRALACDQPPPKIATCLRLDCGGQVHWARDHRITDDAGTRTVDCGRCRTCGDLYYGTRLALLRSQDGTHRVPARHLLDLLRQEGRVTTAKDLRNWSHRGHISHTAQGYDIREVREYLDKRRANLTNDHAGETLPARAACPGIA